MTGIETRPWKAAEALVHYVYLSTMFLNGGLFLLLPAAAHRPYEEYKFVFLGLLGAVVLTFPLVYLVYRKFVSKTALDHIRRLTGEGSACSAFKIGTIVLTCLGDFSGIAGASFFTYTREANGLALFLGSWAVQYALTTLWVVRGKQYLQTFSATTAAAIATRRSAS